MFNTIFNTIQQFSNKEIGTKVFKMKFLDFLITFFMRYFLNSVSSASISSKMSIEDQNLSKSICMLTNDVINLKANTQDILIGNLGGKLWSSTIDDIIKCSRSKSAIVLTDFRIWKVFSELNQYTKSGEMSLNEMDYLRLKDLYQVFGILVIRYALSTFVLIFEIFCFECLKNFKIGQNLRNLANQLAYKKRKPRDPKYQKGALFFIIHRHQKVKRLKPKKLKVRQIFVESKI